MSAWAVTRVIEPGAPLPDLERVIELADLVAYGGATWDWHRYHYDQQLAASLQMPAPIVDGQMLGALLAQHAQQPFGRGARVVAISFRLVGPVFAGDTVVISGTVVASGADTVVTSQEVRAGDRIAISDARTTVALSGADTVTLSVEPSPPIDEPPA